MEKIYKTMRNTGQRASRLELSLHLSDLLPESSAIVNGALLLKRKSEITF